MTEVEDEPLQFDVKCGWCRRQVISFVGPPAMVEVSHEVDGFHQRTVDRICLQCYADLLAWISNRNSN